jgi:glutamate dehydrogenase
MEQTLARNTDVARRLVEYFKARFDPGQPDEANTRIEAIAAEIEKALDAVSNLDEDRILRQFFECMRATVRTNYFTANPDGQPKRYVSFKLDSQRVPSLPEPRPMFEIFVYSTRVEAVHLRGGMVSRGGIRWSDRREDFRTEILGLMKTQMVKNAIIVPVGAKGGFVVKRPPAEGSRDTLMAEVVECYREFICGMLDITDNIIGGNVVPPANVLRYDSDDPYLVVAADKGTATFSDIANAIAGEYRFWLDDAFASGGSTGYDHKRMGITARGAWESVKRHFRELGRDISQEAITVVGIGDMSGDVFGNGMLLSRRIHLVAAFNHRHIFLDPDPDPAIAFAERQRLFDLPQCSWTDYDPARISPGGGVFLRSAKSIRLSTEARRVLSISAERMTPHELITAILRAPVDLLWNGGIGTFVKARAESHANVGDRTNDAIRIDGHELRCKVVGEGGNLGLTQLGRIEYARKGGLINTDSVDNSGGVNCSDREVNIKILCNAAVADGRLTRQQRDTLLADMTEAVGAMVIADNHAHTRAIGVSAARAPEYLDAHADFMHTLEKGGRLDRRIEHLPDDDELSERRAAGEGLTRPELAVLSAYSKLALYHELIESEFPDDPCLENELAQYFPPQLADGFAPYLATHPLRREIIATHLTNSLTNTVGITFTHRLSDQTGRHVTDVARAFTAAREIFDIKELAAGIDDLDNRVPVSMQTLMVHEVRRLAERSSLWLLNKLSPDYDIAATIARFQPGARTVSAQLEGFVTSPHRRALRKHERRLVKAGAPQDFARRISGLGASYSALDIVEVAQAKAVALDTAAGVYFAVGSRLELFWLREQISALPMKHHWQQRAKAGLYDDLYRHQCTLAGDVLDADDRARHVYAMIEKWAARRSERIDHLEKLLADLRAAPKLDLAMLSVAVREIQDLALSGRGRR